MGTGYPLKMGAKIEFRFFLIVSSKMMSVSGGGDRGTEGGGGYPLKMGAKIEFSFF